VVVQAAAVAVAAVAAVVENSNFPERMPIWIILII
jgi:hypothetical protein